eukprot:1191911-Prorocentrum_minimum.AAC.3
MNIVEKVTIQRSRVFTKQCICWKAAACADGMGKRPEMRARCRLDDRAPGPGTGRVRMCRGPDRWICFRARWRSSWTTCRC